MNSRNPMNPSNPTNPINPSNSLFIVPGLIYIAMSLQLKTMSCELNRHSRITFTIICSLKRVGEGAIAAGRSHPVVGKVVKPLA